MKPVRSRSNPQFRRLLKLRESSRERRRAALTLLDGVHLLTAYYERGGSPSVLAVSEQAMESPEIRALIQDLGAGAAIVLADGLFREISPVTTPTGIVAVVPIPPAGQVPHDVHCCVLVEDVQDPGNLGSILRSAAAAGVGHALLSRRCADAWSPRVLRGAMGAHFLLTVQEQADLPAFARQFRGQVVAAAAHGARSIFDIDLKRATAFALGNEGKGLSAELEGEADIIATVPMAPGVESINVGAAAAVFLFERIRQLRTA